MKMKIKAISPAKKVGLIVALALLVGFGGSVAYARNQSKQQLAAAQLALGNKEKTIQVINEEIKGLFNEEKPEFLVENIHEDQIIALKEKTVNALDQEQLDQKLDTVTYDNAVKEMEENLSRLTTTYSKQQVVDNLFQQKEGKLALNGTKVNKDLAVQDDLDQATVNKARESSYTADPETEFEKTVNELLDVAEVQVKQIEQAKVAVSKVYNATEKKVSSVDQTLYDEAKAATDKIKNEKAKDGLVEQLSQVKAEIDKQAAAKTQEQQQATQDNQAKTNESIQNTGEQSVSNSDNTAMNNNGTANNDNSGSNAGATNGGNGNTGYVPPTTGGGNNNGNQGSSGGSTGGGNSTPPSNTYDPMTPIGSGGLFGSYNEAYNAGMSEGLRLQKEDGKQRSTDVWEVRYTDGRSAGWTYQLVLA